MFSSLAHVWPRLCGGPRVALCRVLLEGGTCSPQGPTRGQGSAVAHGWPSVAVEGRHVFPSWAHARQGSAAAREWSGLGSRKETHALRMGPSVAMARVGPRVARASWSSVAAQVLPGPGRVAPRCSQVSLAARWRPGLGFVAFRFGTRMKTRALCLRALGLARARANGCHALSVTCVTASRGGTGAGRARRSSAGSKVGARRITSLTAAAAVATWRRRNGPSRQPKRSTLRMFMLAIFLRRSSLL